MSAVPPHGYNNSSSVPLIGALQHHANTTITSNSYINNKSYNSSRNYQFQPSKQHQKETQYQLDKQKDSGLDIQSEFESSPTTVKKSASVVSLSQSNIFEPRMAQLETLEAKMASIEVSLSSTPRRKKNGSLSGSVRSIPKDMATKELESLRNALRDKENTIQTLKGQLSIPAVVRLNHNIRNGSSNNNNNGGIRELSDTERKQAEERLARLRNDTDTKRLAIKNLKMALERLDITDNIDVRIQQAELEYQLGREELNLLTLLEETRTLQHCLEESNKKVHVSHTLYSCLSTNDIVSMHVAEIVYDSKSPRFGAGQTETSPGLYVDWALDDTGLKKGDRLIEVNGKMVLTKTRDDLIRLLQAAPDPATVVILRRGNHGKVPIVTNHANREVTSLRCELEVVKEKSDEAQRVKDGLRSDNIRLTHRISYLEEQVSELLSRKPDSDVRVLTQSPLITSTVKTSQNVTNINISSQPPMIPNGKDTHSALPLRSKSSLSNVSNTLISAAPSPQPSEHSCHNKSHRHTNNKHRSRSGLLLSASTQNLDVKKQHNHHHHHHHREKDYNSETNSAIEYRAPRKWTDQLTPKIPEYPTSNNIMDQSYRKATKIVQDLTKNVGHLYEKHKSISSSKCIGNAEKYNSEMLKHYNARKSTSVLDFRSEIQLGPKYGSDSRSVEELDSITATEPKKEANNNGRRLYKKLHDARSVKSLDFDSDKNVDYTSEPTTKPKPTPPKKPLRLSLHRAQSLQSVETPPATPNGSPPNDNRKATKRNYKGEAPQPGSMNGLNQTVVMNTEKVNGYSGKTDYHNTNGHHQQNDIKWTSFAQTTQNNKRDFLLEMHREQREQREQRDLREHREQRERDFREQSKRHWC